MILPSPAGGGRRAEGAPGGDEKSRASIVVLPHLFASLGLPLQGRRKEGDRRAADKIGDAFGSRSRRSAPARPNVRRGLMIIAP
jgi:hypothetical protein